MDRRVDRARFEAMPEPGPAQGPQRCNLVVRQAKPQAEKDGDKGEDEEMELARPKAGDQERVGGRRPRGGEMGQRDEGGGGK
eukprot:6566681-Pyramimonas_sp.AAC.1